VCLFVVPNLKKNHILLYILYFYKIKIGKYINKNNIDTIMMNIHISDRFMLKYLHLASECDIEDKLNSIEFDYYIYRIEQ
jgi:hypothetical protein